MSSSSLLGRLSRLGSLGVLLLGLGGPATAAPGDEDEGGLATYGASQTCARCHSGPNSPSMESPRLIRHDEFVVWSTEDRHSRAYQALADETSREMIRRLGWPKAATEERRCLSCHGTDRSLDPDSRKLAEARPGAGLDKEGVSCVACHGGKQNWITEHALGDPKQWMRRTAAQKQARGLNDLRDPARRARLCLSCHIGNPEEDKDLTHEIYAAGHPPLGSVEVEAFSQAMARHWFEPKETPYIQQAPKQVQREGYHFDPEELSRARRVATAGVAKFLEESRAMNRWAEAARQGAEGHRRALDFARFDCTACHHDLQAADGDSWRQRRGFPAGAGRPPAPGWPAILAAVGDGTAGARFAQATTDFDRAAGRRPFGDPARLASASAALVQGADQSLAALGSATFDRASAATILRRIGDRAAAGPADFESARQLAWAFWAVATDLDDRFAGKPEVKPIAEALDRDLDLGLFGPRKIDARPTAADRQGRAAAYDPARFRGQIAGLARLVPK